MRREVNVREINQRLSQYINTVNEENITIIITRRGEPIAELNPVKKKKRKLTAEQKAAKAIILAQMEKGFDFKMQPFNRDEAHER